MITSSRPAKQICSVALTLLSSACCNALLAAEEPALVNIALRSAAATRGDVVLLGDIADIEAKNLETRRKIARIDIADPIRSGESSRLTRSQVSIRLMLAGFESEDFRLTGAEAVNVSYESAAKTIAPHNAGVKIPDEMFLGSVRSAISQDLALPADTIHLTLLQPARLRAKYDNVSRDDIRLEARLPSDLWRKLLSPKVGIHVDGRLHEVVTLALEMRVTAEVLKTTRDVQAGELLSAANLRLAQLDIEAPLVPQLSKDVFGKRAARDIQAGEILVQKLVTSSRHVKQELLVRRRETVQLVARRGALVVKTQKAVALDSGRLGDQIRVQNEQTGRIVRGRVAQRWIVEINF